MNLTRLKLDHPLPAVLLLSLAVTLVYGNTLQVPWYFDDHHFIVDNPALRNLGQAWAALQRNARGLSLFTFALNYHFGGLELAGYHLVNIAIHLLTSLLVYSLFRILLPERPLVALCGALLFAVHPLQTQAVTYIVQRMTSLSGLFFFLAIVLFLWAQDALQRTDRFASLSHLLPYGGALLAGLFAVLVKQNAATLPVILLLLVWLRPATSSRGKIFHRICYVLPFFAAPLWLTWQQVAAPLAGGSALNTLAARQTIVGLQAPQPLNYLFTEFSVLWLYLRLVFLPFDQALDYSYPVVNQLWTLRNIVAGAGLAGLLAGAWRVRKRLPLTTLGIAWFFVTLAVESTLIPLDPVFEHRMYVPLFGVILVGIDLAGRLPSARLRTGLGVAAILVLAVVAWQRNALWTDPVAFYEQNLQVAPHSERVMADLANRYLGADRNMEAEALLARALELNPRYPMAYETLVKIFIERGEHERAMQMVQQALRHGVASAALLDRAGVLLDVMDRPDEARQMLERAIALRPRDPSAYVNLGAVLAGQGHWAEAADNYRKALALIPEHATARFNLGVALYNLGQSTEAREQFRQAMNLAPGDADALYNFALTSLEVGDHAAAAAMLPKLRQLNAIRANELEAELAKGGKKAAGSLPQ